MNSDNQSARLPLAQSEKLDRLCDKFEADCKAGNRPQLEEHMHGITEPLRSILLHQLLLLEKEYRESKGEQVDPVEYEVRFPLDVETVRNALQGSKEEGGQNVLQDTAETVQSWDEKVPRAGTPLNLPNSRYEVISEVARGGMGVVYLARHRSLDKLVALKVLQPGRCPVRFLREARLLAQMDSPYVVGIYDHDALADGRSVIALEWIEGGDLTSKMKRFGGRIEENDALEWMRQTSMGMCAAEEQGVTHRDLKPSNILIDLKGRARVADFGLARDPEAVDELSRAGQLMGTPSYMAPEQAEDPRTADTRSDIYSFGATFYHAMTGRPPFVGETPFAILYGHKMEPLQAPQSLNSALSSHTSELLERCLAKSPSDRFQSFAEIVDQLNGNSISASPWYATKDLEMNTHLTRYSRNRARYLSMVQDDGDLHTYVFPNNRILRIIYGDIVSQQVDAIVSSDNMLLTMETGVSSSIRKAAGESIRHGAQNYVPVRPGRVVVTSAGKLTARFVFHAVTIGWTGYIRDIDDFDRSQIQVIQPSRDLIVEIMSSCFYHADSLHVRRIAFPLLGTGAAGFSREVCLDTEFRFLARQLLRQLTCVEEANIMLFQPDSPLSTSRDRI